MIDDWMPKPKGVARGPKSEWGKWRASRDRKITAPRRNKAAEKLTKPKNPE